MMEMIPTDTPLSAEEKDQFRKRFSYDAEIVDSLERYPNEVYWVADDIACKQCRGRLVRMHFRSSPQSWAHLAGREGYLTICPQCGTTNDFFCTIMN